MAHIIELNNIVKSYRMGKQTHTVLHGINMTVEENELVAIMGPSGSGKSTVMNIIGLLDKANSGSYRLNGTDVSQLRDDEMAVLRNETIGFVFQQFYLLPRLTALDNVALPLSYRGMTQSQARRLASDMLIEMGIGDRQEHRPNELSGGQQQRVAIARALVGEPKLLLADEPTGALDTHTSADVMTLFKKLHKEHDVTVVIVTHNPEVSVECQRELHVIDGVIEH